MPSWHTYYCSQHTIKTTLQLFMLKMYWRGTPLINANNVIKTDSWLMCLVINWRFTLILYYLHHPSHEMVNQVWMQGKAVNQNCYAIITTVRNSKIEWSPTQNFPKLLESWVNVSLISDTTLKQQIIPQFTGLFSPYLAMTLDSL